MEKESWADKKGLCLPFQYRMRRETAGENSRLYSCSLSAEEKQGKETQRWGCFR